MLILTGVVLFCLLVSWVVWRNSRFVRLVNAIPGPRAIPVLGNIRLLGTQQAGKTYLFVYYAKFW